MSDILCPHGKPMYQERIIGTRKMVSAGIPKCCFDMLCTPASGETFIIVNRKGIQRRIHSGICGNPRLID